MKSWLLVLALVMTAGIARAADFLDQLPQMSTIAPGYNDVDSVEARLDELPLCPAEGMWQMTGSGADGAIFVIERAEPAPDIAPSAMRMVMIRCPWRSIRPGTVLGHVVPTAKPGVYEARIYSTLAQRSGLSLPRKFTLKVNAESNLLTIEPFRSPLKVNLFKLLPYLYRRVVTPQSSRPQGLDGAVRIYPAGARHPLSPVYL